MRHIVLVIVLACVCALGSAIAAFAQTPSDPAPTTTSDTTTTTSDIMTTSDTTTHSEPSKAHVQKLIDHYRRLAWYWQRVMGRPVTWTLANPPEEPLQRIRVWQQVAAQAQRTAAHPPHLRAWLCIHRFEGSWTDPNPPYYGGLQMDLGFQRTYGRDLLNRKGTADHWTPLEQIWVAERALRSGRGFYPWPNTARYCGLI